MVDGRRSVVYDGRASCLLDYVGRQGLTDGGIEGGGCEGCGRRADQIKSWAGTTGVRARRRSQEAVDMPARAPRRGPREREQRTSPDGCARQFSRLRPPAAVRAREPLHAGPGVLVWWVLR